MEYLDGETLSGVLAYEMFTQRHPFDGDSLATVVTKVLSAPPPPMETSWSRALPELERIVFRAIAKAADERYASAEDMKNALAALLASSQDAIASAQADFYPTRRDRGEDLDRKRSAWRVSDAVVGDVATEPGRD